MTRIENIDGGGTNQNWKVVLAYDGTDFQGWQVQPGPITIQGELSHAIERITGERVLPQGSGRTDAGVHALGQVASFALEAAIPPANFLRALNRTLPSSIRVISAEIVAAEFHARHSAIGKTYEYRIIRDEICSPFSARYAYALNWPLNLEAMKHAAELVIGQHDFTSFAAHDPDAVSRSAEPTLQRSAIEPKPDAVRTIRESVWTTASRQLTYRVTGSGFLHHMVRNLVGTFLDVGRGRFAAESIPQILAARDRSAAGPTAPARGLFLVHVIYRS